MIVKWDKTMKNLKKNLFSGPTNIQSEKIKEQQQIETKYVEWIYNYRKINGCEASLELCNNKYRELKGNK